MSEVTQFPDLGGQLSREIIKAGIEVHRNLGPGLLESLYEECLAVELKSAGLSFEKQKLVPVVYKGVQLSGGFRPDFIVENKIIVELKAVENIQPIHEAQLLSYMRLANLSLGLLVNFNVPLLKNGIKRMALSVAES